MGVCTACGAALPEGARFCSACAAPVQAGSPAAHERKLATVLFADLVGSTALAGEEDPERTRVLLERFYDAMSAEVVDAGGTVEKFAGDAVMAAFGAPAAQEDHAERALHVALSMQRRLAELFGETLALRIGVNTGDVVVGRPREGSSFVTGDAVNVAARLEQAAAPGEILAGERTVAAARGAFEFDEPATVEAKGKPGGVSCCRVIRALSLMRPRGVSGLRRAFVGRDRELDLLLSTYERVADGQGAHVVTLMGDAGVGKTRLLRELWDRLGACSRVPLRRTGRCLPYGRGITYFALGEVLKEHLGLLESDSPDTAVARLGPRQILGLTLGLDVAGELHPLAARDGLHEAWIEFAEELTAERPLILLVEDVHWAEEPLLDLLERLARDVRGALLLIATARPELLDRRPTWGGGRRNSSLLWLDALTHAQTERMLEQLLGSEPGDELARVVVERADGNPFFVEELVASLIDRGVLARRDGGWEARELPPGFSVPDSVQAILAARIDLLAPRDKAALQAAAVIGRIFWRRPVRELLGGDEPAWDVLEDRDFVRRRSGSSMAGDSEYAFKHALTREVAYGTLPKVARSRLHARFAAWLEDVGGGRDEHAPLLAHHYAEAVRPEDADLCWDGEDVELRRLRGNAAGWLRRAAEVALTRYDVDEALALLARAVELEDDERALSLLWRAIGRAHALRYDGPAFWSAMEKSLATCHDRPTCADSYSVLAFQTAIRSGMWTRRPSDELVDGWIDRALTLSDDDSPARCRALLARAAWHTDDDGRSAREAGALAERLGDPELRSWAWATRAMAAFSAHRFDEAATCVERRFELASEISDPDHLVEMLETAAPVVASIGRLGEARRLAREHRERSRTLSPHHRLHALSVAVEVEELAGCWETIRSLEKDVAEAVDANLATPCVRNERSLLACAAARAYAGDYDGARELEDVAEARMKEGYRFALDAPRIRLALARGDLTRVGELTAASTRHHLTFGLLNAVAWLDALAALGDRERVEELAPPYLRPRLVSEPFALRALGVVREDAQLLRDALARFEALQLDWHAEQTRLLLAGSVST